MEPNANPNPAVGKKAEVQDVAALAEQIGAVVSQQVNARLDQMMQETSGRLEWLESRMAGGAEQVKTVPLEDGEAANFNDRAVQLFYENDCEHAAEYLEQAVKLDPSLVEAWNNLAMVYSALGRAEDATDAFKRAQALDADHADVLNGRAVLALLENNPEEAIQILERANHDESNDIPALLNLAEAYLATQRHDQAMRMWQRVTALDPHHEEARRNLRQYWHE
jgi:Tfp pilus assembly protein PilF